MNTTRKDPSNISIGEKLLNDISKREVKHLSQIKTKTDYSPNIGRWRPYSKSRYVHKNLLSVVAHPKILEIAYYQIRSNKGIMTPGSDPEQTLDGMSLRRIEKISKQLKDGTYEFTAIKRVWIPKPGRTEKRPLGIPSPNDKIVQTSINMVLTAMYEPEFNVANFNYGFRPRKGVHDAVETVTKRGKNSNTVIEGDIKSAYPSVDHDIFLNILSKRTTDRKFLKLIRKLLKTEVMDEGTKTETILGVPQGATVSPTIWNIYAYEFDIFIHNYIRLLVERARTHFEKKPIPEEYTKKVKEYRRYEYNINKLKSQISEYSVEDISVPGPKRDLYKKQKRTLQVWKKAQRKLPGTRTPTETHAKMIYIRYADDWVILLNGPPYLAKHIKRKIAAYLKESLKLTLADDKTKITNPQRSSFIFLGHSFYQIPSRKVMKTKAGNTKRVTSRDISTKVPFKQKLIPRLHLKHYCDQYGYPREVPHLSTLEDDRIILHYRQVLLGLANFYAPNCPNNDISRIFYIMTYSCYKTLAQKHKTQVTKIISKYKNTHSACEYSKIVNEKKYSISVPHYKDYKAPTRSANYPQCNSISLEHRYTWDYPVHNVETQIQKCIM